MNPPKTQAPEKGESTGTPFAALDYLRTQIESLIRENSRLNECLRAANAGDVPKGWDDAIARAERAEQLAQALRDGGRHIYALAISHCRHMGHSSNPALDEWGAARDAFDTAFAAGAAAQQRIAAKEVQS